MCCEMDKREQSGLINCILCGEEAVERFEGVILGKYRVKYYQCPRCKLLFTEPPYWLNEAYEDSITSVDTGIMSRNVNNVSLTNCLVDMCFDKDGTFLDYGGGYGIFTRMMRDLGYNWLWQDKYSSNLVARNYEWDEKDRIELITAFELLEHFDKPKEEFDKLFSISKNLLCSTLLYDKTDNIPNFNSWWYYVKSTGQHITFYSEETMIFISKHYGVNYYKISDGLHLFSVKTIKMSLIKRLCQSDMIQFIEYRKRRKKSLANSDMDHAIVLRENEERYSSIT